MVRKFLLIVLLSPVIAAFSAVRAESGNTVTLSIPESVLREAIKQSLPFELDTSSSKTIGGRVFIKRIDNLQLADQSLSALLVLAGQKINIITKIGGHELRLNVGDVEIESSISALVRYDEASRTLFVKPQVSDYSSSGNGQSNELGNLLVALFNGREFPVTVEKLQPLITDLGNRQLAINLTVQDILITDDVLTFNLTPAIEAYTPEKKSN